MEEGMDSIEAVLKQERPGDIIPQHTIEVLTAMMINSTPAIDRVIEYSWYNNDELIR